MYWTLWSLFSRPNYCKPKKYSCYTHLLRNIIYNIWQKRKWVLPQPLSYIFATHCYKPWIFQTLNFIRIQIDSSLEVGVPLPPPPPSQMVKVKIESLKNDIAGNNCLAFINMTLYKQYIFSSRFTCNLTVLKLVKLIFIYLIIGLIDIYWSYNW